MAIALTQSKLLSLTRTASELMEEGQATVRDLAHLLGSMVSAHPAVLPAPLYYRNIEIGFDPMCCTRGSLTTQ